MEALTKKIETNCGRINYDINYKIQESFLKFKYDTQKKLDSILASLQQIISRTIDEKLNKEKEIEGELETLKSKIEYLNELKTSLLINE